MMRQVSRNASRNASRFKARATAGLKASATSGAVEINRLSLPASVPKNSTIRMEFGIRGNTDNFPIWDPDYCVPSNLGNGVEADVRIESGAELIKQETFCLPENGEVNRVIDATVTTPATGDRFTVTVTANGASSGNVLAEQTYTVGLGGDDSGSVDPAGCITNADCPDGMKCQDGECVSCNIIDRLLGNCSGGGGGGGLISPSIAVGGVLFLIVLIAILAP